MTDRRPPTSVDFDPVRLQTAGRRRFDPAVLGALVVVVALAFAIVKPWANPAGVGSAERAGEATPVLSPAAPASTDGWNAVTEPRDAVRYLSLLRPHRGWGIRAVVASPGGQELTERWRRARFAPSGAEAGLMSHLDAGGEVLALGVTAPAKDTPLGVRVYRIGDDGEPTWLDTRRIPSDEPAAELLLLPPTIHGVAARQWPAGQYRFDLLVGDQITPMHLALESPPGAGTPAPTPPPRGPDGAAMPPAWLGNVPSGVFTVVDGVVRPLVGEPGPTLDPAEVWLESAIGNNGTVPRVASSPHAGAARVGVMLPGGAHDASGVLRRLTPGSSPGVRVAQTGARVDASNNPTAFLLFRSPDGEAWPAGVYAIEATWKGPGGPRAATWHLELTPGSPQDDTNLMAAARSFRAFAGGDGLLIGGIEQIRDPEEAAKLRPHPIGAERGGPAASLPSIGCDDIPIDTRPPVIGLTHPVDRVPQSVELAVRGPFDRATAFELRTVVGAVPGLTLLAPGRGPTFPAGAYRMTIRDAEGVRELKVCIGVSPARG